MTFKLCAVYDKVNGAFSLFHFLPNENDAVRGFVLNMASPCDLSFFHDDYELYELGIIDDQGVYTKYSSRKLLITGNQAYKAMKDYHLDQNKDKTEDEGEN